MYASQKPWVIPDLFYGKACIVAHQWSVAHASLWRVSRWQAEDLAIAAAVAIVINGVLCICELPGS
jgi:hypothetical protein